MNSRLQFGIGFTCAQAFLYCDTAAAAPIRVVAQYGQTAPGTTGTFRVFSNLVDGYSPAFSGDNVAFGATTTLGAGIFAEINGQLRLVADTQTPVPNTASHFGLALTRGSGPSISGNNVAFAANVGGEGPSIWMWRDGELVLIADTNTPVPGSTTNFQLFGSANGSVPVISGETVVFTAIDENFACGVYAYMNGALHVIADESTILPGANQPLLGVGFNDGVSPAIDGENIAFFAAWDFDGQGIYAYINGEIQVVADTNTPAPGAGGATFNLLSTNGSSPSISGENVAFVVGGVYARINGGLLLIADTDTPAPGSSGNFFPAFGGGAGSSSWIDGDSVVFTAAAPDVGQGVFAYVDGELQLIVSENTYVPGLGTTTYSDFGLFAGTGPAIEGREIVFMGNPAPGIYIGQVTVIPTVSEWGLVLMALLLLLAGSHAIRVRERARPPQLRFVRFCDKSQAPGEIRPGSGLTTSDNRTA